MPLSPPSTFVLPAWYAAAYRVRRPSARPIPPPADGSWRHRQRVPLIAVAVVIPLYVLWAAVLATGGGDLAAQDAWAAFVARYPGSAYNLSWYGGMHVASYSVLSPYAMAWLGVRTVAVLSGVAASWAAAALFVRAGVRRPLWPAVAASLALWCDVASGRTTFALGTAFGIAACLALTGTSRNLPLTAGWSALATMASPVAGLFLLVAGAAWLLTSDLWRAAVLVVPPIVVVGLTTLAFPFSGEQPMSFGRIEHPCVFSALIVLCAPRQWRRLRLGCAVYALGVVLAYCVASPVGDNVERLAEVFAPAALLACLLAPGRGRLRAMALVVGFAVSVTWLAQQTANDLTISTSVPAWAAHTRPVVAELGDLGADRTRVEVVPDRDHREAVAFASHFDLARGWNRQVDLRRNGLFYDGTFSASTYLAWLHEQAVGYVVLHDGRPDDHAVLEAALVRHPPDWLQPVWHDADYSVFRVRDATPMVSGPASVLRNGAADVLVRVSRPGSVTLRIAFSPWLRVSGGCLAKAGPWTRLTVPRAGVYDVGSRYRSRWPASCPAKAH
jgi:hypothetical protein